MPRCSTNIRMPCKPLAGLKIVSLAVNLPGPVAAARLRNLGAERHEDRTARRRSARPRLSAVVSGAAMKT